MIALVTGIAAAYAFVGGIMFAALGGLDADDALGHAFAGLFWPCVLPVLGGIFVVQRIRDWLDVRAEARALPRAQVRR